MSDENWDLSSDDFRPTKTFLDPVHGDIPVLDLEHRVIDTASFQRLRGIKQLGTADLVFHGAKHDRFAHSLGTMAVAEEMVASINARVAVKNEGATVPERARYLIRLAALLHDIGHAPYGHQLEDDFPILPKHDRAERFRAKLGADSEIGRLLSSSLREELIKVLSAKDDKQIEQLEFPFAADIVGNTVCADLLDYTRRDVYHTGLDKKSGWRMLKYLYIAPDGPARNRVVIDAWKNDRVRSDVISDVLDLLDVRFALSERVIFHHTKMATGAMLARAVADSALANDDIAEMRDDQLLVELGRDPSSSTRELADGLLRRSIHRTVWITTESSTSPIQQTLTEFFAQGPNQEARDEAFRRKTEFEDSITSWLGLPQGSILVSCTTNAPLYKKADSRIRIAGTINKLLDVVTDPPSGAITELRRRHSSLWRFYVFLAPSLVDEWAEVAVDAVDQWLRKIAEGARNEIRRWQPRDGGAILDLFARQSEERGLPALTVNEREQLIQLAARGELPGGTVFETLDRRLADLRAPDQPQLPLQ